MGDVADYEHGEPKPVATHGPSMHDLVMYDLQARKVFGLQKYGTLLQAHNGRNPAQDAYEEVLDLSVYLKQLVNEWNDILQFLDWLVGLNELSSERSTVTLFHEIIDTAMQLRGRIT